ncbi:MAG TPA: hypothetical protein VJ739_02945, partial [Gemmataceae bacterium]|nr:hypothetical protein [Gemmataceae bacterium]
AAMLKGDVAAGRAALARINDNHGEALRLAAGLLDSPMIDPFSLIAYTYNYVESSAVFVPNGKADPVSVVTTALSLRAEVSPGLRPYFADAVKALCVIRLIHHLRAGRPVGLSDDILFSGLRRRPRRRADTRSSADYKREMAKRHGRPPDPGPDALPPQASGALPHEELCSDPEDRKRYLGRPNAPRWWFLERNVGNDGYYLCTGLWYNAMTFADKCDPSSRERWAKVFDTVAQAYAEQGRYTSGVIVKLLSSNNAAAFLQECGRSVDARDAKRVTNLVIALGYFLEATRGKWSAGLKGTALGELHTRLAAIAVPAELERARRCGDVDRAIFEKQP